MRSLNELLSDPLLDLLEGSAEEACQNVRLLENLRGVAQVDLEAFSLLRQKHQQIAAEIAQRLAHTSMIGLRKEDIVAVSIALSRIPQAAERLAMRWTLGRDALADSDFGQFKVILVQVAESLAGMVHQIRVLDNEATTRQFHVQLRERAEAAEVLGEEMIGALWRAAQDPVRLILVKDIVEHWTAVGDRCSECGDLVEATVLKYG